MQIHSSQQLAENSDAQLLGAHCKLDGAMIVELGCGRAFVTRKLAESHPGSRIIAAEVDQTQHNINLQITDLPNVTFQLAGMENLSVAPASVDTVIMLKSLHHVPSALHQQGFENIFEMLRTGGKVYISEPVFAGEFNQILRLFNDEEQVRKQAFEAIRQAIDTMGFTLEREIHFLSKSIFADFAEFEGRIINATHSDYAIDEELLLTIREKFDSYPLTDGQKVFMNPMRADILVKP